MGWYAELAESQREFIRRHQEETAGTQCWGMTEQELDAVQAILPLLLRRALVTLDAEGQPVWTQKGIDVLRGPHAHIGS
jgi:hypothetical protein